MKRIKAFTLTESLIMIAIVGVIATITMVSLSGLKPNKDKLLLQKAYTITMSAVAEITNDPVAYPPLKSAMNYNFDLSKQIHLAVIQDPFEQESFANIDLGGGGSSGYSASQTTKNTDIVTNEHTTSISPTWETFTNNTYPETAKMTTDFGTDSSSNAEISGNTGLSVGGSSSSSSNGGFVLPDIGTASSSTGSSNNSSATVTLTKASAVLTDRTVPTRDSGKYTSTNKFAYLFSDKLITSQTTSNGTPSCSGATCTFNTNDGISWTVTDGFKSGDVNSTSTVVVDINGSRGPNKSYNADNPNDVKTPDRFTFTIRANGQVLVPSTDAVALKYLKQRGTK